MYTLHPDKAGADIWYEQGAYQEDDEGHKIPLDFNRIYDLLADPYAFVSMCQIDLEGGGMSYVPLSRFQKWLLYGIHTDRWVIVDKYRQAYMTTVSVLWLLRDCMYLKGTKGVLIACDDKTAEDAFERVLYAYEHLPHAVRVPLRKGHRGSIREIKFVHGGSIKIVTASGRSPAVGRGLSRIVVTEWGETIWQTRAAINLFPTIYKRPHGRLILESTPGRAGSHHQAMWFAALDAAQDVIDKHDINVRPVRDDIAIDEEDDTVGSWASWEKQHPDVAMILAKATLDGMKHGQILLKAPRYRPLFLAWWQDPSTRAVLPRDFVPTAEEVALINTCPGIALENLAFRRQAIKQFFNEDSRLFDAKYPPDPWSGWLGAYAPRPSSACSTGPSPRAPSPMTRSPAVTSSRNPSRATPTSSRPTPTPTASPTAIRPLFTSGMPRTGVKSPSGTAAKTPTSSPSASGTSATTSADRRQPRHQTTPQSQTPTPRCRTPCCPYRSAGYGGASDPGPRAIGRARSSSSPTPRAALPRCAPWGTPRCTGTTATTRAGGPARRRCAPQKPTWPWRSTRATSTSGRWARSSNCCSTTARSEAAGSRTTADGPTTSTVPGQSSSPRPSCDSVSTPREIGGRPPA